MRAWDFRRIFADEVFAEGETLFELYARDRAEARALWEQHWGGALTQLKAWWRGEGFCYPETGEPPANSVHLGRVVLKSPFLASAFGDQLPFRHPTLQEVTAAADSSPAAPAAPGPGRP
jgi:hypothetical protein